MNNVGTVRAQIGQQLQSTNNSPDEITSGLLDWIKRIYRNNQGFCKFVDSQNIRSFVDFEKIFDSQVIKNHFPTNHLEVKQYLLSMILGVDDRASDFIAKKFDLAKNIISLSRKNKDSDLAFRVLSQFITLSLHGDIPSADKIRYRNFVIESFKAKPDFMQKRDPDVLPGHDALLMLNYFLVNRFSNTLSSAIDIFNEDDELLRSIIERSYNTDPVKAYELVRGLISGMQVNDITGILYHEDITKYAKLARKIEGINVDLASKVDDSEIEDQTPRSPASTLATVEVLGQRATGIYANPVVASNSISTLVQNTSERLTTFLKPESDEVFLDSVRIDTSSFPFTLVDIAEGLEIMFANLAPTSPLRTELEDFYYRLPALEQKLSPEQIKTDLIKFLKPRFNRLEPLDIFGKGLGTIKNACTDIYNKVSKHREPSFGQLGRRRTELPYITWFFAEGNISEDGEKFSRHNLAFFLEDSYGRRGNYSFRDVARAFNYHFSSGDTPILLAARNFIEDYLPEAQQVDPKFTVVLESSHNNYSKVKHLYKFLEEVARKDPEYNKAAHILKGHCSDYLEGKLNDQSFLREIQERANSIFQSGDAGTPSRIYDLLNEFMAKHGF